VTPGIADYRRLSAALTAARADRGRASGPQYPGVVEAPAVPALRSGPGWPHPLVMILSRGGKLPGACQSRCGPRPSAEQSTAQGPSVAAHLHPSGVARGHEPLTMDRKPSVALTRVFAGRTEPYATQLWGQSFWAARHPAGAIVTTPRTLSRCCCRLLASHKHHDRGNEHPHPKRENVAVDDIEKQDDRCTIPSQASHRGNTPVRRITAEAARRRSRAA
jgi:hypothetical protein